MSKVRLYFEEPLKYVCC